MEMDFHKPAMKPTAPNISPRSMTVTNYVLSGIFWLLVLMSWLFALLGPWSLYHLFGFVSVFFAPISLLCQIISIFVACKSKEGRYIWQNILPLLISVPVLVLTILFL